MSMAPEQFAAIRKKFFPDDPVSFMLELGYTGNRNTLGTRARRFESGEIPIPRNVSRFVWLLEQWSLQGAQIDNEQNKPDDLPDWPEEF